MFDAFLAFIRDIREHGPSTAAWNAWYVVSRFGFRLLGATHFQVVHKDDQREAESLVVEFSTNGHKDTSLN